MKNILYILGILLFLNQAEAQVMSSEQLEINYSSPVEYEIGGIEISGTQFLDRTTLKTTSELQIGDKITIPGTQISKAIANLWDLNLFSDVSVYATKVIENKIFLRIDLEERPRLSKFSFKGVRKSEADDIREEIKLVRGKIVTDNLLLSTENIVKTFFVDKGYLDCTVNIETKKDTLAANSVIIVINVAKNGKIRIREIEFVGNKNVKSGKLRRTMKETKRYRWWNIFKQSKLIEENINGDKAKIIAVYNAKGYRDAQILKDSTWRAEPKYMRLRLEINEGNKFYFRNITWLGNSKYSTKELNAVLNIKKGDIFDQSLLDSRLYMSQDSRDITSLYMDDGYLFFQISPVEVMVENDSIDIEMRIYEGKQATINKVTVMGNTKTNDKVIMREIRTKPGQLFSRADIIRSQRELSQLRYFDPEKMGVNPKPNPVDGTVDIEYTVEEKPSDQVELSGGWGNKTIVGTLGVSFNNFSSKNVFKKGAWTPLPAGDGQSLSLRAQSNGLQYQSYNASFVEPWLGGKKPNSFSTSIYRSQQNPTALRKDNPARQTITTTGVSFGLGKRLMVPDDYFTLYQEINFQHYDLKNFQQQFIITDGSSNNFNYKISLSRNSLDQVIYPRSGSSLTSSLQITPPYSYLKRGPNGEPHDYSDLSNQEKYKFIEYHKWKFTASFFTKLIGNLVLNTKAGFGYLGYYNNTLGASPFERFQLGGSGLTGYNLLGTEIIALRGYDDGTVSPAGGGTAIAKYTMELRYPVSLNPSATIFGLIFAEAGNNWNSIKKFNPFQVKRSMGLGVRIFLPMFGLLGLDYGWGFDSIEGNPYTGRNINTGKVKGQFHFTIGAYLGDL